MRVRHLLFSVVILTAATACGSGDDASDTTSPDTTVATTEAPTTEPTSTEPPTTEPPATEPPATEPPATDPPLVAPSSQELAAALPTAADLGTGWTDIDPEPILDPAPDQGPGIGACGGTNAATRAQENGVVGIARTVGAERVDPSSFTSTTLFSFPSADAASAFVAQSIEAHGCTDVVNWELVEGPGEDQVDRLADGFGDGEVWVHDGTYAAETATTDADEAAILTVVVDRRLTIADVAFGEEITDVIVLERYGNLVTSTVLSGQCCYSGYLNLDDLDEYTPADEEALALAAVVSATALTRLGLG